MVERLVDAISSGGSGSPPIAETNPPYLLNQNPSPGQTGVLLNPVIQFRITDDPDDVNSGVDINTLVVEIKVGSDPAQVAYSAYLGGFQPGFAGSVIDVFADNFSYDVTIDPSGIYPGLTQITVFVTVRDKQPLVVNLLDTSYFFTTKAAETSPPFLSNEIPAPGSGPAGNLLNTNIFFRVNDAPLDPDSGVKLNTLLVEIRRGAALPFENAIVGGVFQPGFSGTIIDGSGGLGLAFNVDINPDGSLQDGDVTSVRVNVDDTKVPPNHLNTTYSFSIQQADIDPPFVANRIPAPGAAEVSAGGIVIFDILDTGSGVNFASINVLYSVNAVPAQAILNGVFQSGFTGTIDTVVDGYRITIIPDNPVGNGVVVEITADAEDIATVPNPMPTTSWQFTTLFETPVAVVSQQNIHAIIGSIIQLDARKSFSPDGLPITWSWRFRRVPIGSKLQPDLNVVNPGSMKDLKPPLFSAISFIPDKLGQYIIDLSVSNGGKASALVGVKIEVGLSRALSSGTGTVPDAKFLWTFLSNFYNLVEDREYIQVVWSAVIQLLGAEFIKAWSNDYNKSLSTIQQNVQRLWQRFELESDLSGSVQRIIVGNTTDGTLGTTGNITGPTQEKTNTFRVLLGDPAAVDHDDFTLLDVNYGAKGRIIDINGEGFTIERVRNLVAASANLDRVYKRTGLGFTDISQSANDPEQDIGIFDAVNDYLYFGHSSKFSLIKITLSRTASLNLGLAWQYTDGTGGWISFVPTTDTMAGFTSEEGEIGFDPSTLVGWSQQAENGSAKFYIRAQRTTPGAITTPIEDSIYLADSYTVINTTETEITDGLQGVPYRIPQLLHVPKNDLEEAGVSAGDTLVFEVRRKDINLTAELRAQVVTVDKDRVGFEFTLEPLVPGGSTLDHTLFHQLVRDLRIVPPQASDLDVAAAAEALIAFIPTGINLSERPFSIYQIIFRAKKIIHNTKLRVDDMFVSIPHLQEEIRQDPPVILRENFDYILEDGYIQFTAGLFTLKEPAPEELWAEVVFIDNSPTIEANFGHLVELGRDDLVAKATRAPYLGAVRGLWFAITNGPTIDNIRLGMQILMGLPFSEERGEIISITENFSTDTLGHPIGRILAEDVDEKDRRTGLRRFYFYPQVIGIEDNPITGEPYKVGDVFDRFKPLSKGVLVTDYVKDPLWWVRNLRNNEILKFFTFKAEIDTESGVFNENDFVFTLEFINKIRPIYTRVVAAVIRSLEDDITIEDSFEEAGVALHFYENVGAFGGHESTVKADDFNQQGLMLWQGDSRPFSTRSLKLIKDVVTAQNGAFVEATSATGGFGTAFRVRQPGDAVHPGIEGDILVIHQNQPGSSLGAHGLYELTAGSLAAGPIRLGNHAPTAEPTKWAPNVVDSNGFPYGSNLRCSILRRALNPVVKGTDLVTSHPAALQLADSLSAKFVTNGVAIDDHLIIESGANKGEYRIVNINTLTAPRNYTPAGTPQISDTQVGLVRLDGTDPALADLSGQDFRIIRPSFQRVRVEKARVIQSGGSMYLEVVDVGGVPEIPFDVFTPGMVGARVNVANAQNHLNNGDYTILEYDHAGRVRITAGAPQANDAVAQAIATIFSPYHTGFEKAEELAPTEVFSAVVTGAGMMSGAAAGSSIGTGTLTGTGAMGGAAMGSSAPSGGLSGGGAMSGSSSGGSTVTGTLTGVGAMSGSSSGSSSVTGTLTGTGAMSGSSSGSSSVSGTLTTV